MAKDLKPKSGIAAGINKGHAVTVKKVAEKPVNKKGVSRTEWHFRSALLCRCTIVS